jgi:hypothetical protein
VRLAVDAATTLEGSLARFRPNGANWMVDSPPIAAVDNVGVLLNGNVIVNTALRRPTRRYRQSCLSMLRSPCCGRSRSTATSTASISGLLRPPTTAAGSCSTHAMWSMTSSQW